MCPQIPDLANERTQKNHDRAGGLNDYKNSPLFWFRGYWNDEGRTAEKFVGNGRYCLVGDTVSVDPDGYFYFSGRTDDIILCAGYRIGPFEVESALMKKIV